MNFTDLDSFLADRLEAPVEWEDGSTAILMDEGDIQIGVEYIEDFNDLYLYGEVAGVTPEELAGRALDLLKANLFAADTGGFAAFGYDEDDGALYLWDRMRLSDLDRDGFEERFYRFYLALRHWKEEFPTAAASQTGAETPASGMASFA